jgi:hypothetical protein
MAAREAIGRLLRKSADRPMSLADACLVRIAELNDGDGDLSVYGKHGRRTIALVSQRRSATSTPSPSGVTATGARGDPSLLSSGSSP